MVYTLQRYIFRELFKVFILSAVALSLMMSLGSLLEPIQKFGVAPSQVLTLLVCFMPVILTFVLPVAAIFSSALIYGRFASDNELDACRASGVSLPTLIYPGLFLGIVVSITTLILSFHVMPSFIQKAEQLIKADAKQICFRNIQRKGFYEIPGGRFRIQADYVDSANNQLFGVVIVETKDRTFRRTIDAQTANIQITPHTKYNDLEILATDVYDTSPEGEQVYFEKLPLNYQFESLLGDNIRFKKLNEIKQIQANPMEFYPVQKFADQAYARLVTEMLADEINAALTSPLQGKYYRNLQSDDKHIIFSAQDCVVSNRESKIELTGVTLIEYDLSNDQSISQWQCNSAVIQMERENDMSSFVMTLYDASRKQDTGEVQLRFRPFFRGLKLPVSIAAKLPADKLGTLKMFFGKSPDQTLIEKPSPMLISLVASLEKQMRSTLASIKSEINSRLVFGIGSISLILISIGLGIMFKGGHLLFAFGISVIPAAFLLVCMMAGKNMTKNLTAAGSQIGVAIMWAGFIVLLVVVVAIYKKLLKM